MLKNILIAAIMVSASAISNAAFVEVGKDRNMIVLADTNTVEADRNGNVRMVFKIIFSAPKDQADIDLGEKVAALFRQDTYNCYNGTGRIDRATWVGVTNRTKTFTNPNSGFDKIQPNSVWQDMYKTVCESYLRHIK